MFTDVNYLGSGSYTIIIIVKNVIRSRCSRSTKEGYHFFFDLLNGPTYAFLLSFSLPLRLCQCRYKFMLYDQPY